MARKRTRIYGPGDKIQVNLSKELSPEFLEWINKQSDLTNFFLYGVQQLYQKTGNVDVATIMPRKIDIETIHDTQIMQQHKQENISQEEQSQNSNVPKPWGSISNNKFEGDPFS